MDPNNNSGLLLQQVYKDKYCQISISVDNYCIYQHYYELPLSKEAVKPSIEIVLSFARGLSVSGSAVSYLLEVIDGKLLPSEDVTWLTKEVIQQLADCGIRYVVYVSENNLFRKFNQDNLKGTIPDNSLNMGIFQNRLEALHWLEHMKQYDTL